MKKMIDLYNEGNFDTKPNWINWKINGHENVSIVDVLENNERIETFSLINIEEPIQINEPTSVRSAIINAASEMVNSINGDKIALCLSGKDSEVIAAALNEIGADFEIWFADYWKHRNENVFTRENVIACAEKYKVPYHIIGIEENDFVTAITNFTLNTGICEPAISGLTALFNHIPNDQFIVMGDGDLGKNPHRYNSTTNPNRYLNHKIMVDQYAQTNEIVIPFIPDEVMMRIWAQQNKRKGQYLFNQNINVWAACANSNKFLYDKETGEIDLSLIYEEEFPDLIFKNKTDPFFHPDKRRFKNLLRDMLSNKYSGLYNETGVGCCYLASTIWKF
jgi:hypothetical protein